MNSNRNNIAVLGASGSIGKDALEVVRHLGEPWRIGAFSVHSQIEQAPRLASEFRCPIVVFTDAGAASKADRTQFPDGTRIEVGSDGLVKAATETEIGTVVAAVVGAAGMASALAAANSGKRLALANKEALVAAGQLLTVAATSNGGEIIPVDSEHSAIFQALHSGNEKEVSKLILTASGGPFRTWDRNRLESATVQDALAHPTWRMGRKITIDSATMMNKALEIIEARWLFGLRADQIEVVIHPQSIIHSMVEFVDGSVVAQLSPPDMRLPIQYALTYPDRQICPCDKMDWTKGLQLDLEPVDHERFPALRLGWEVAARGGSCGAVLNAANEAAVELFLQGRLRFTQIVQAARQILEHHNFEPNPNLEQIMRLDRWARQETCQWAA